LSSTPPPLDKPSSSNVDIQYDKIKKLMKELDDLSGNFDSVILAQDQVAENIITLPSSDQNNRTINNSEWGFIQDKDLYREKEKLLKHVVI